MSTQNINATPLVSIITPCYNSAKFIGETIDSIQAQTFKDWELIITDDCSTDNTTEIIERYIAADPRIKLYKLEKNSGGGVARNNSIKEAKGRYIAFCDSDDRWHPWKLAKQLEFMQKNDYAFSYTSYMTCDEDGAMKGIVVCPRKVTYSSSKRDDKIGCLTIVYDSEKIGKHYLPEIRKRHDWGMKLRILKSCKVAYGIKEPLALYRIRRGSVSSDKKSLVQYNIKVYQVVLGWSKIRSILFFLFVFIPSYALKKALINLYNR